jgi:hypothetical protein
VNVIKSIFSFYITSSIHVAFTAFSLTWITMLEFDIDYEKNSLYFVFFATIMAYNFVKYFGLAKFHYRRLASRLKFIQVFSVFSFVAMGYFAIHLNAIALVLIGVLGMVTFLYAIPLIPKYYLFDDQQNLRQIGGLKIYVIALVWTGTTVLLPIFNAEYVFTINVFITAFQRFCLILVLMLPFEIRDLNYDNLKLATIPQKIGIKNTKVLGVLILIVFTFLEFFKCEITRNEVFITLLIVFLTFLFLLFSKKNQSKYYSAFLVESVPIVWLILLLLLG